MSENKVNIKQWSSDDAFRIKVTGGRTIFALIVLWTIMLTMCATEQHLRESNELRRAQLEQSKRQYTLDSLRFEYMMKQYPFRGQCK